jgi:hypothetical protein
MGIGTHVSRGCIGGEFATDVGWNPCTKVAAAAGLRLLLRSLASGEGVDRTMGRRVGSSTGGGEDDIPSIEPLRGE